jgi:hypothetical protein
MLLAGPLVADGRGADVSLALVLRLLLVVVLLLLVIGVAELVIDEVALEAADVTGRTEVALMATTLELPGAAEETADPPV